MRRLAAGALLVWANLARAQSLDGTWVTLGPVAAATHVEDEWVSAVGLEVSVVRVTEKSLPAALGICGGGVSYASLPGGRLWLEGEAGIAAPLPFPIGLAAGLTARVDPVIAPKLGAQATLWFLAGLVPFVRVGAVAEAGIFVEAGVMLKIPARRFP